YNANDHKNLNFSKQPPSEKVALICPSKGILSKLCNIPTNTLMIINHIQQFLRLISLFDYYAKLS
ncbi:MAG: hypothetical protein J7L04_09385, partial [Bacteroidales bacterium]|nr:hypothetical protein [Bacteroidales bacterium]